MRALLKSRSGATAIEYSLIAAMVALVIVGAIGLLGTNIGTLFNEVGDSFPD